MTRSSLDPVEAWTPWQPTPADPWNRKWAAHLYRRAAFGASRADLLEAERLGFAGTLDLLFRGRPDAEVVARMLSDVGRVAAARDDGGEQLRGWWLYAMLHGGHPLREKLTLFWHNHFATSIHKVRSAPAMFRQNELLRAHALGAFGPFLQAIGRDPAMLVWLDSNSNVKGKPNENYARELMELFSLGVGNYTEADIREAARAFTGWHTDGDNFHFNATQHDDGLKSFLGSNGNWDGTDVARIVLEQPACARFLVHKLYAAFVSEAAPPDELLEPLCVSFRNSNYDTAALLRTMLSSRHFFSDRAFRQRIKGPVEFALGAANAVYGRYAESHADHRALPQQVLVRRLANMGQVLFAPPNVKGWPGGRAWLTTATVLERNNFAAALASGSLWSESVPSRSAMRSRVSPNETPRELPPPALDPARLIRDENVAGAEAVAQAILALHVPGGVRPEAHAKLVAFLGAGRDLEARTREAVHAVMTMPEYQLA